MDYDYKQAKVSETQYSTPTTNLIATSKNSSKPLYSQKRIARLKFSLLMSFDHIPTTFCALSQAEP